MGLIEGRDAKRFARRLTAFEVLPAGRVVEREGAEVGLRAVARFDDGPAEDVTAWTAFAAYGLLRTRSRERSRSRDRAVPISALALLPATTQPSVRRPTRAPSRAGVRSSRTPPGGR